MNSSADHPAGQRIWDHGLDALDCDGPFAIYLFAAPALPISMLGGAGGAVAGKAIDKNDSKGARCR